MARSTRSSADKRVSLEKMIALADAYRRAGRTIVFTNGCFDLLHVGHVACLEEAAQLGDILVVAVNSDAGVRHLKGPGRPVISQEDRAILLSALACVDHVVIFNEPAPNELIQRVQPDVLVKGGTYTKQEIVGVLIVEEKGGRVCVTVEVPQVSTTNIIKCIQYNETCVSRQSL